MVTQTKRLREALVSHIIYPQFICFRSLAKKSDNHLYIGTTDNCILEGSLQRKLNLLIWGHRKRLDALAVHPDDMAFVTAGHDKVCCLQRGCKLRRSN